MTRFPSAQRFARYTGFDPEVPVARISSGKAPSMHRFFDSSPISPSGRFAAFTEFPGDSRLPSPGEEAWAVVVDLEEGREVYRGPTAAWDTQLGAQVQWGGTDHELFYNRMGPTYRPYGVKVDIETGAERQLSGPIYVVSPDGRQALSTDLTKMGLFQPGYGVIVPPAIVVRNRGAADDDGVFVVDTVSGETSLLLSYAQIHAALRDRFADIDLEWGGFYGFHTKWNADGSRVMLVLRWLPDGARARTRNYLITFRADGSELSMPVDARQWKDGHHPNWCGDGQHIVMNFAVRNAGSRLNLPKRLAGKILRRLGLRYFTDEFSLRFARFKYDGSDFEILSGRQYGSGHPTLHPDGRHLLTDAYPHERVAAGDGTVPLRLMDIDTDTIRTIVRIAVAPSFRGPKDEWRVDPHPAWDRTNSLVCFNAAPDGVRQVYLADLSAVLAAAPV